MNPKLLNQTRLLVEKYDESLRVNASLNAQIRSFREIIGEKEANASTLMEHYQDQICHQTTRLEELKEIIRARDIAEKKENQKRKAHDKSISIKLREAETKEATFLGRIQLLEEEVERLTSAQIHQREKSEQKHLDDQIAMKESFEKEFENLRQKLVSNMYQEMGDALSKTMQVNDKLTCQLKAALFELESMQINLQEKEKELSFANREIKLLKYKEKLIAQRRAEKLQARAYLEEMKEAGGVVDVEEIRKIDM